MRTWVKPQFWQSFSTRTLNTQTLGLRAFALPTELSRITLEYHGTHEYRRGGDNLDLPAHEAWVAEQTDHRINAVDLGYMSVCSELLFQ